MDFCELGEVSSSDKKKKIKFVLNGNPMLVSSSQTIRDSQRVKEIADIGCKALNIQLEERDDIENVRIFRTGGVELFEEDVKYLKANEILYVSTERQDFDDSNNFAMYKLLNKIGKGGYGHVYEAKHRLTKQRLAIKLIHGQHMKTAKDTEMVFKEIGMLKNLHHKNIIKVFNCYTLQPEMKVAIVFEYLDGGDLKEFLEKQPQKYLEEELARRIFSQLVSAMQYCHREKIIHRDLKLENIMFTSKTSDEIKVVDFGISGTQSLVNIDYTHAGSARYFAPEVLSSKAPAHPTIDVWAMGCILYWLLVGESPFPQSSKEQVFSHILKCEYSFPEEAKKRLTRSVQDLIYRMLIIDPSQRITLIEMIQHPWLTTSLLEIRESEKKMKEEEIAQTPIQSNTLKHSLLKANATSTRFMKGRQSEKLGMNGSLQNIYFKKRQSSHSQREVHELRLQIQRDEESAKLLQQQRQIVASQRRGLLKILPQIANQDFAFITRKTLSKPFIKKVITCKSPSIQTEFPLTSSEDRDILTPMKTQTTSKNVLKCINSNLADPLIPPLQSTKSQEGMNYQWSQNASHLNYNNNNKNKMNTNHTLSKNGFFNNENNNIFAHNQPAGSATYYPSFSALSTNQKTIPLGIMSSTSTNVFAQQNIFKSTNHKNSPILTNNFNYGPSSAPSSTKKVEKMFDLNLASPDNLNVSPFLKDFPFCQSYSSLASKDTSPNLKMKGLPQLKTCFPSKNMMGGEGMKINSPLKECQDEVEKVVMKALSSNKRTNTFL